MITKLIRPVAVICALAMLASLYSFAMNYPNAPSKYGVGDFAAIVSLLPIAFTAIGLCFAKKDGPFFVAYCVVLLLTGYSMYKTGHDDYYTSLFMRSLVAWGSFLGAGFLALVSLVLLSKRAQ